MCGINGVFKFKSEEILKDIVHSMNDLIIHRGPDDEGIVSYPGVSLGMRRLSIIDIEGGEQPIFNEDNTLVIVFNGEIYNYIELREQLISKGHVFKTNGDTEVILHLYEEYKENCLQYLNGMFAIAIYDLKSKELFVARDRLGIKPFYYFLSEEGFVFSSDLSSLRFGITESLEIDPKSIEQYFAFSYIPNPRTVFKKVQKLIPGNYLKFTHCHGAIEKNFWKISNFTNSQLDVKKASESIYEILEDAVKIRMRSDVPVGTFLSGGLDSSIIVALMAKNSDSPVHTFSVGFKGGNNELETAKIVSKMYKTKHTELVISENDIAAWLPDIIDKMDEPLYDNALFPSYALSKIARDNGVKVILNGTGGDEVFGGYARYIPTGNLRRLVEKLPLSICKILFPVVKKYDLNKALFLKSPSYRFFLQISGLDAQFLTERLKNNFPFVNFLNEIEKAYVNPLGKAPSSLTELMHVDLKHYLSGDVLSLLDKMTMAASIEGRTPFLDYRLVEFLYSLPDEMKFGNNELKSLMKKTFSPLLPHEILSLPKKGFGGPTQRWLELGLMKYFQKYVCENPHPFLKDMFDLNSLKVTKQNSNTLWGILILSLWLKRHLDGERIYV